MQADDDERRDLERALYARPDGDAETETRRREAAERLRIDAETRDTAAPAPTPREQRVEPLPEEAPPAAPRRSPKRAALIALAALAAGLALGAAAASVALDRPTATAPTASPSARPADRFEELVSGWEETADLPAGFDLIAAGATVYTPGFETAQDDRLLLTAPNGTTLCLALQQPGATYSAGCVGLAEFFDGTALQVASTAQQGGSPVYTRVQLNPDGTIEGGFQLVGEDPSAS